jgi:hypothetical protein
LLLALSATQVSNTDSVKLRQRPLLKPTKNNAHAMLPPSTLEDPVLSSAREPTPTGLMEPLSPKARPSKPSPMLLKPRPLSQKNANAPKQLKHQLPADPLANTIKCRVLLKYQRALNTVKLDLSPPQETVLATSKLLALSATSTEPAVVPPAAAPAFALPPPPQEHQEPYTTFEPA